MIAESVQDSSRQASCLSNPSWTKPAFLSILIDAVLSVAVDANILCKPIVSKLYLTAACTHSVINP